jgi:hypothetical protein
MKSNRKIFPGLLIGLTILFCLGLDAHSNPIVRSFTIELSSGSNNVENSFSSDIDSVDDDQNSPVFERSSSVESDSHMPITRHFFLVNKFFLSVWQPPKIS